MTLFYLVKGGFVGWLIGKAGYSILQRPFLTLGIILLYTLLDAATLLSVITNNQ